MTINLRTVINAVATRLHDTGVGYWPGPEGTYPDTPQARSIYAKRLPPKPAEAYAVTAYGLTTTPDPDVTSYTVRVQVRSRAPYDADPMGDDALNSLHGLHHQEWAGLHVDRCQHLSTAQLGADSAGLDERTDNFELTIH